MNENERIALNKMISENDVQDQTKKIRTLKHSDLIKQDVFTLQKLKSQYSRTQNTQVFKDMCVSRCSFLFNNYTDIYNRLVKDEIDMNIFLRSDQKSIQRNLSLIDPTPLETFSKLRDLKDNF